MKTETKYVTLKEAAAYLHISYSHARKTWPSWEKMGVHAYRPFRNLLFDRNELEQAIKTSSVN